MIILTNDDGIEAPGLKALEQGIKGEKYVVVAPAGPMSECSHCVTTSGTIRIKEAGHWRYAVAGTPADCVRVALLHILPTIGIRSTEKIWVYSGINAGGNLGADVYISGTVAAAREAAFHGLPAIAFSQYRRATPDDDRWQAASRWTRSVLEALAAKELAAGEFWNVNFPWVGDLATTPEIVFCERSRRPLPVKYEQTEAGLKYVPGLYHTRQYESGSDIDTCFNGRISISRIAL